MLFSPPPGGPPRELWLWEIGVGMGRDLRGNGQLQLNVTFIGPSVGFIPSRLDRSRPSGLTFVVGPSTCSIKQSKQPKRSADRPSLVLHSPERADSRTASDTPPWFMGTPQLCLCGCSSTEQILQTVHSPPAFSLLQHIVYALTFHSWCRRGGIAARATEQTVEKGGCHLYPVPRRTCLFIFLFELQAVELSPEFDVRKLN